MSRIEPVRSFSSKEVRDIRISVNLTQIAFAAVLGVSKKTVEAWECGRNTPSGSACRLLSMMEKAPDLPEKYGFVESE